MGRNWVISLIHVSGLLPWSILSSCCEETCLRISLASDWVLAVGAFVQAFDNTRASGNRTSRRRVASHCCNSACTHHASPCQRSHGKTEIEIIKTIHICSDVYQYLSCYSRKELTDAGLLYQLFQVHCMAAMTKQMVMRVTITLLWLCNQKNMKFFKKLNS